MLMNMSDEMCETVICEHSDVQISFIWLKPLALASRGANWNCVNSIEKFLKHIRYIVSFAVFVIVEGFFHIKKEKLNIVQRARSLT